MELLTELLKLAGALVSLANGVMTFLSTASRSNDRHEESR